MIRRLELPHISQIREIAAVSFPRQWTEQDYIYFIENESARNLGFFNGDKLEAYFLALVAQGDLDIVSIATLPESRRKGLAKKLLLQTFQIKEVQRCFLEVDSENSAAIKLYLSLGFKEYGRRKGYYEGKRDALLMTKVL